MFHYNLTYFQNLSTFSLKDVGHCTLCIFKLEYIQLIVNSLGNIHFRLFVDKNYAEEKDLLLHDMKQKIFVKINYSFYTEKHQDIKGYFNSVTRYTMKNFMYKDEKKICRK